MSIGKWSIGAAITAVLVVGLLAGGALGAVTSPPPPASTYTVWITEKGLPSGTSWSATFNGVTNTGTGTTLTFTANSAGSYCYYPSTITGSVSTTEYVPTTNFCITVPNVQHMTEVFQTYYYTYFTESPSTGGSLNVGSQWLAAGSNLTVSEYTNPGYTFSTWSAGAGIAIASPTTGSTELTVSASGVTVTADFTQGSYTENFYETGLAASTKWSVDFNSVTKTSTSTSLTTASTLTGSYSYSVPIVTVTSTEEYVPTPSSGSVTLPSQRSVEVVFTKEWAITFATTGTGSVYPSSGYYPAGANISLQASSSSELFSKWTTTKSKVYLGSTADAGTNATVKGATTVTAVFKTGKLCTSCTLTFSEVGLPTGTAWGVTFNSQNYGTTTSSVKLTGVTISAYWNAFNPVSTGQWGVEYSPSPYGYSSGYYYLGYETTIEVVYEKYAYVSVVTNPSSVPSGGATLGSAWYPVGSVNPISAYNGSYYTWSNWASSNSNVTLGSTTSAATTFTVTGPATITENFVQPINTLHFREYGLPSGTTWGLELYGSGFSSYFYSSTPWINVTGLPWSSYSAYPVNYLNGGTNTEWNAPQGGFTIYNQGQYYQSWVYEKAVYVTFTAGPSGTSGTVYTPSTNWYYVGTWLPLVASNGTGTTPTFSAWSQTTGTGTISSTSAAATFFEVLATGTVTCTFT